MLNWLLVAKQLGFESEQELWTELYSKTRVSLPALAKRLGTSVVLLRAALAQSGISLRSRGGPNNYRFSLLSPKACELLRTEGITAAARRLHVRRAHLYRRLLSSEHFHTHFSPGKTDEDEV